MISLSLFEAVFKGDLMLVLLSLLAACSFTSAVLVADDTPPAIQNYVSIEQPEFSWKKVRSVTSAAGKMTELRVVSQKWHGIIWNHAVEIFEPKELKYPSHALLFVTGGSHPPKPVDAGTIGLGSSLAKTSGMRVVVLHQVPNQPLFDNRYEDDLITETWLKYLEDGDETWPLLFPMVKSATATMDAVQQFAKNDFAQPIESFIITGASKRGWTSWLTPVVDKRIVATAPIVIDTLHFRAQMKHQLDTWGDFSVQIKDYSSKGLIVTGDESAREKQLRLMMDPYTYRDQLKLPKLLVNGTNDPYWVVDAMNNYWDDLQGPKFAIQIPNAGHSLDGGREKAIRTVGAFARMIASKRSLPEFTWRFEDGTVKTLRVTSKDNPMAVRLWSADSTDLDFRDEEWGSSNLAGKGQWVGTATSDQHTAMFIELEFQVDDIPYSLCTLIYRR